jgi:hypothetical protein
MDRWLAAHDEVWTTGKTHGGYLFSYTQPLRDEGRRRSRLDPADFDGKHIGWDGGALDVEA